MHDEDEAYAEAAVTVLAREGAAVPANFQSEISNALLQAERRHKIDSAKAQLALTEILALPLTVEAVDPQAAVRVAREHRLTSYAAFYLALAVKLDAPLATVDRELAAAARSLGYRWEVTT